MANQGDDQKSGQQGGGKQPQADPQNPQGGRTQQQPGQSGQGNKSGGGAGQQDDSNRDTNT